MATGVRKCFFFVKENVSSDWKNLAYHLGFGRADIDNISSRNPDSKSCCMDLLEEWQQRKGDRATKEVLVEALTEANLQSVVDGLKMDYTDLQVGLHLGLRQQPATSVKEQYLERILELERTLFTVKVLNDPVRYRKVRKTFNAHKALLKKAVDGSIILLLTFLCQSDVDGFYHNHFRVGEGSLSQQLSDILITDELQKKVKGVQLIVRLHVKHEDYVRVRTRLGQGLHRTTSVDNLRTLPTRSCHLYHSSLRALDLAVVNGEDQACTVGVDGISSLKFTVKEVQAFARAGKGKSQQVRQLEDKLQVMRGQLHTARQETVAVTEEVARLKEKDEKAQKLVSEQKLEIQQLQETNKAAEQDTQALVKRLANEADRVKHEDEKAQKTLQELKLEIQQLKESNLSMKVTIDELQYSKHTAKGQDYGRKMVDPVKMEDPGKMEGPGTMEDTINPIKLQELETDVRKQLCQFSENEPFNVLVLGRPESGKSSFINSMHMAVAHRWYEVARYGDGSRMRAVSTDLVRYEMFRDELMEQPIEGYNHGVFFWDTAGLENCHTEITVTMLGLIMEGRIPPHTIIHEYTDVRKSRSLTVSSLERRFPHSGAMEEWKCHRVVFVCAADEEPSMNLMEAVTDAACKDEADARSLPIFLVMSKCDKVDRDGDAMYKSRRDNAALSLMVYRNNVRCKGFLNAATEGDEEVVKQLLQQGVDVNCTPGLVKVTPLHKAASGGHVGVAELLLKAGAQVDSRDELYGEAPLHKAASGGHVGVAELLLKAGAQVDSKDVYDRTSKDIAESTDVPSGYSPVEKARILEGRKNILHLFATAMSVSRYKHITRLKVGPEGGKLRTTPCTVIVPGGAVTKKTEITCGVIIPNDFTLPLEDGAMLVSDVIELGPHGTTFHQPVTVQMQYSSVLPGGAMEAVILVTEDRSQWKKLKTTKLGENKVSVSVNHFSIFAVVIQPKQEQFTVSTEGWTQVSSTQPAVQVSFSEGAVTTPSQVTLQVQEVPKQAVEDTEAEDQSSCRLISASPIVKAETISDSAVQFLKPITVRVPHPHRYMDIQHEGPTQLRVMSCEEGVDDWVDETDNTTIRVSDVFVEFEVTHFTRWIVIVVTSSYDDPEELDPLPLKALRLSKWLKQRTVQFILMQRKDNANEFVIECTCTPAKHADKKHTTLLGKGYKGPLPTDSVKLFEGQIVEIDLLGYVSIAPFVPKPQITFHSQKSNRFHLQIVAVEAKGQPHFAGKGVAAFYALPRVEVSEKKMKKKEKKGRSVTVRKEYDNLGNPPEYQKRFFLCQLPIHVPIRTTKLAPEQDAGTSKGVEMYFFFIKSHVSTDWKDLAFHLGIKWATIRNIAGRNRDDKSCCMDMLQEWKKREGDAATTGVLMKALSEAELQSVVDGLKKKFPDIVPGNQ